MISVSEAKNIIKDHVSELDPIRMSLAHAAGKVSAEDVFAPADVPGFEQSAMDGYAFAYKRNKNQPLKIVGELQAGAEKEVRIKDGQAARIFTGAPLPEGADTVVMQEKTSVTQLELLIEDEKLQKGSNVRLIGSEIRKGVLALDAGSLLTPAAIGFLAGIGIDKVNVYPQPKVSIIVTGKELQVPGKPLQYGQVYESNSFTLAAALQTAGIGNINICYADDDLEQLTDILNNTLSASDMVLLTGGVSVGDYDFVIKAAEACSVKTIFHKVKQRPGKPLFFGKQKEKVVFGLPGNPSSVLTCFYQYVLLALEGLTKQPLQLKKKHAVLKNQYNKTHQLIHFLKGFYDGDMVEILEAQESYRLRSFAKANCLIELDEASRVYQPGENVSFYLLPV